MKALLIIEDEINIKFEGISVECRRKMVESLEYFVPGSKYLPSVKLGRWNGKASHCTIGGRSYLNLLDILLPIVQFHGYEIDIDDRRKNRVEFEFEEITNESYSHIKWPKGHVKAGESILLRDHQVEMTNCYLNNITGINVIPTAGGKTAICAILSHKIEPYGRSIVIVPTKDLVTQTEDDYKNFGLDVGVFFGDRKEYNKTHTICTWQSLESLSKRSKDRDLDINISDFFENVICVISDEVHRAGASILRQILSTHLANVPIRWGLTGTMPEEKSDQQAIISCIGPLIGKIKTTDLQEKGILANLNIHVWQMQDLGEVFDNYQTELKWLTTSQPRLKYLANEIIIMSESGSTLILVDRIETGEKLKLMIPESIFVSGKMKSKDRKEEYAEVQEINGKVIIATYGVASTGISINRIFNLVLFESGKSFTRVIQSIGRGLRVAEDKTHVNVYDVCSNCKFSKRHLTKRKKFYSEASYPFTVKKVQY